MSSKPVPPDLDRVLREIQYLIEHAEWRHLPVNIREIQNIVTAVFHEGITFGADTVLYAMTKPVRIAVDEGGKISEYPDSAPEGAQPD